MSKNYSKKICATILCIAVISFSLLICFLPKTNVYAKETNPKNISESDLNWVMDFTYSYVIDQNGAVMYKYETIFNPLQTYCGYTANELGHALYTFYDLKKQKKVEYDKEKPNQVTAYISYPSLTELYIARGIKGNEKGEITPHEEVNFWFNKYSSDQITYVKDFLEKDKETGLSYIDNVALNIKIILKDKSPTNFRNIDYSKIKFNYVYGTKYKSITTNANLVNYNNKVYYHNFYNLNEESKFQLEQKVPNSRNWYIVLLIVTAVTLVIGTSVIVVKKNTKVK